MRAPMIPGGLSAGAQTVRAELVEALHPVWRSPSTSSGRSGVLKVAGLLVLLITTAASAQSLTLQEALDFAKEHQPTVRSAAAQTAAADARAREALSPMLPQVSAAIGYSRSTANFVPRPGSLPSNLTTTSTFSLNSFDFTSANLSANQLVYDFGQTWWRYRAALESAASQQQQLRATQVATALQVRSAYFQARAQHELVDVAQATLQNTAVHLKQVEGNVEVGTRPPIDLAQAKADTANARLALVNAKNSAAVARARLNQAMGRPASSDFEVSDSAPGAAKGEESQLEALVAEAVQNRPEVQALDTQLKAQGFTIEATKANYWPSIGASLGGTLGARELTNVVPNLSGGLSFSWPLYQGGLTTAQVSETEAQKAALLAQRDSLVLQVRLDVEQAQLSVGAAKESVEVAGEALEAAKERLRLAEGRYTSGAGNAIELGDAQVAFTNAAAQRVQAVYSLATARAQLMAALGRE